MKALAFDPALISGDEIAGRILCQDVVAASDTGRVRLSKGRILTVDDAIALRSSTREIHLIELGPGDIHEDAASTRLAAAIAGDGLVSHGPIESQTHLRAAHRGLVEIRADALETINSLPDVSVFTVYDGQPVMEGKAVAAAKVTPLAVPQRIIQEAEEIAAAARPVVRVRPFLGGAVGVVVREGIEGSARARFEAALQMKIGWFGSSIAGIAYLPSEPSGIAAAIEGYVHQGVALILAAGVNSTDPLDPTLVALEQVGARTERRGVPSHPGSTCWLAYLGDIPIFGLALCGMFSQTTVLDLLLPRFLSCRQVRAEDIARLGHGGLLSKDMAFRFPTYREPGER